MSTNRANSAEARARRERIRQRHHQAALDGVHLPSVREMLLGSPWISNDIQSDCATWADRMLRRLGRGHTSWSDRLVRCIGGEGSKRRRVADALNSLCSEPTYKEFEAASAVFRSCIQVPVPDADGFILVADDESYDGPDLSMLAERTDLYAASLGSSSACLRIAQVAAHLALDAHAPTDETGALSAAALGWLSVAKDANPVPVRNGRRVRMVGTPDMRLDAQRAGAVLIRELLMCQQDAPKPLVERRKPSMMDVEIEDDDDRGMGELDPLTELIANASVTQSAVSGSGVVVLSHVGSAGTREGTIIAKIYAPMVGTRLPLTIAKDLSSSRATLLAEFPHAASVISAVLGGITDGNQIRMQPTILVGSPGCGKTSFAIRMLDLLGVRHALYACGGVADASLAGTPRAWTTAAPSLPVSLIARHRTASPGIVLDELEKAGTGRHNGNLVDALLSMLEPTSSSRWHEPYLQSECDLSHVIWLGTANSLDGIPAALRDRCRVIRFPSPSVEHLPVLAASLLREAIEEQGMSTAWATPLDGTELSALAGAWKGGSIRSLRRLVDCVLAARDRVPPQLA